MLVLQRDLDQRLIFDLSDYGIKEPVTVMITKVRGNKVWLGTTATDRVRIYREEVWEDVKRDRENGA